MPSLAAEQVGGACVIKQGKQAYLGVHTSEQTVNDPTPTISVLRN